MVVGAVVHAPRGICRCLEPCRVMLIMHMDHSARWSLDMKYVDVTIC